MLEVEKINVSYGKVQVIWDLSLEIRNREVVTVLGSNGAGKTTTVKTIAGLLNQDSGKIRFKGKNIDPLSANDRVKQGLILVPEEMAIFSSMSVRENLTLGSYARGGEKKQDTLQWIYEVFPKLEERSKQKAGTLSGGEQKMVAIGKALMARPDLLILDEPSLGLAPNLVHSIFDVIRKLKEEGVTILLVEQNVHHALESSDRAYVLEKGRIIQQGKSRDLLEDEEIKKAYLGI